jgi:uroporphyrinogen decarboxylase
MSVFCTEIVPDFEGFRNCVLRTGPQKRVHFAELYQDNEIKETIYNHYCKEVCANINDPFFAIKKEIIVQKYCGYDMLKVDEVEPKFPQDIPGKEKNTENLISSGVIGDWKDFESYQWPQISEIKLKSLEWLEKNIPDNMKCYCIVPVGIYKMILGYETMCYMLYDQPDLMKAVLNKINEFFREYCKLLCQFKCVGLLWVADDMGFKTQTFLPPEFIVENILPLHKVCVNAAHRNNRLCILHSCGNIDAIMDDIINIGYDAKHSFEDVIMPVTDTKEKYGSRISLIGGIDIDFLCRASENEIRERVRQTLDICMKGSGYCLGSGNSITKYMPVMNYFAMIDEGRKWSAEASVQQQRIRISSH